VFDLMRAIAIIAVVLIHVTYLFPYTTYNVSPAVLDAMDALLRFAVPIFFISSGVLLQPVAHTIAAISRFYWRKIGTLFIPYALVTGLLTYAANGSATTFLHNLATGNASVPFYFIITLFQLYLLYPWIERLARKRFAVYTALLTSIACYFVPQAWELYEVPLAIRFVFFFMWGIYMRAQLLTGAIDRSLTPWLVLVGAFIALYTQLPGEYFNVRPFYGIGMFAILYLTLVQISTNTRRARTMQTIGTYTLFIFLLHYPIMEYFTPHVIALLPLNGIALFITYTVLISVITILVSYIVGRLYETGTRALIRTLHTARH